MPSATALRLQIEHALEYRFPAALSPVRDSFREVAPTGITAVDELLGGGVPVGAICEITGEVSSGRTSLALALLANRTQEGLVAAWVDSDDAFDTESAAAAGVELKRLLWVRCRGSVTLGRSNPQTKPWAKLDQALRSTDLLLQAGGFASIVLDLGSTPPDCGYRIPLATWFRFRHAAARTRCSLLVLGQTAFAQSSAALVLECAARQARTKTETVWDGFTYEIRRSRLRPMPGLAGVHKLPASTWSTTCTWKGEKRA